MDPRLLTAIVIVSSCLAGMCFGYGEISGSCNGVYGVHLPNENGGDGGYRLVIDLETGGSAIKYANITLTHVSILDGVDQETVKQATGSGSYRGFLLKAFDTRTGIAAGNFVSPLPNNTVLYDGCSAPESAVSHFMTSDIVGTLVNSEGSLTFRFSWQSTSHIAFQVFVVESTTKWFEFREGIDDVGSIDDLKMDCRTQISIAAVLVGYAPMFIFALFAIIISAKCWDTAKMRYSMHETFILNPTTTVFSRFGGQQAEKILSTITFNAWKTFNYSTNGEKLMYIIFFASQAMSLYLFVEWVKGSPTKASISRGLGRLLQVNFSLAMYFPTRKSVWSEALGIGFERYITYHRMIGRSAFFWTVIHFILMWTDYGIYDLVSIRPNCFGLGNIWGFTAGCLSFIMMLGSFDIIRRKSYELFRITHFLAMPVLLLSCLHATSTIYFLIPPTLLYCLDILLRTQSRMAKSHVMTAKVLPGDVVELVIKSEILDRKASDKSLPMGLYVLLQCSDISWDPHDWHPFSISDHEVLADDSFAVHIKSAGSNTWSHKLFELISTGSIPQAIRVEGPYKSLTTETPSPYSTIMIIVGGIGVTPFAPLMRAVLDPHLREIHFPKLRRVYMVWTVQKEEHFSWFQDLVQALKMQANLQTPLEGLHIHLSLHVTRLARNTGPVVDGQLSEPSQPSAGVCESIAVESIDRGYPRVGSGEVKFGRPDLPLLFEGVKGSIGPETRSAPGSGVLVLACGPQEMSRATLGLAFDAGFHAHAEGFLY